jgi:hypothetical protein
MFRHASFLVSAIAVFAFGAYVTSASAGGLESDVHSFVRVTPLQARSSTPVVHTVQASRLGMCQPYPACDTFSFAWDFGTGTFADSGTPIDRGSTVEHVYGAAGIHPWAVRISQDALSVTRNLRFATHDENWPPFIEAYTFRSDYKVTNQAFTINAYARDDSPASAWGWGVDTDGDADFNDATVVASGAGFDGVQADVTYTQDGLHTVSVRITDGEGASGISTFNVRTHTANEPPLPGLTISGNSIPATVHAGDVSFWDEGGTDDYTPTDQLVHSWTIDGQLMPETGAYFTRQFAAGGPHTVVMKVTDGDGLSATVTGEFTVVDELPGTGGGAGFLVFDDPAAATDGLRPLQNIWLEASDSLYGLPDAQLAWDLDGDGQYDDDFGTATGVSFAADGTYEVGLRAGDPAAAPATVRRTLVVGPPADGGTVTQPATTPPAGSPPSSAPIAIVPFGRRLLTAGPIVLTDGVPRGTKSVPGRNAPGLNLKRRTLLLGTLFASRPARVQATASARLGGGASASRAVTVGRTTLTLAANASRRLQLKVPATMIRRLRTAKRVVVTTRLVVTESGRKPVASSRIATLRVVPR